MRHQDTLSVSRPANPNVTDNDENVKNAGKRKGGGTSTHAAKSRASDPNVTDKGEHFKDGGKRKGGGTSTHAAKSRAPDPNVTNNAGDHDNDCEKSERVAEQAPTQQHPHRTLQKKQTNGMRVQRDLTQRAMSMPAPATRTTGPNRGI
jgi:hypothetical protein